MHHSIRADGAKVPGARCEILGCFYHSLFFLEAGRAQGRFGSKTDRTVAACWSAYSPSLRLRFRDPDYLWTAHEFHERFLVYEIDLFDTAKGVRLFDLT